MDIPSIHPPRLKKGDTISIVAPAGTVEKRDGFERGIATLERMGFNIRFDERIFQSHRYLAGDDHARAEELMRAFEDPDIAAIIALRGGYGCARLIPLLEEHRLRPNPKVFMGFSDLTTLHMYFQRRFGWITIHGPMAASATLGSIPSNQENHLLSLLTDPDYQPALSFHRIETWFPGTAEGPLVGGCLSIVAAGIGTPYEIETEGRILFLEDQGEPPYRLDRMLTQLLLAGKLQAAAGILLGDFLDCEPDSPAGPNSYTSKDTLRDMLTGLDIPVIAGFPAGHALENWAIPLGTRILLDGDARTVRFLEAAVQ